MVLWVGLFEVLIAVVCFVLFLILFGVVCRLVLLGLFACLRRCWYCFNSVDWCLITYCMAGFWFDYLVTCVVILRVLGLLCCLFGVFVDLDFVLLVVLVLVLLGLYLLPDLTRFACLDLAVVTCGWVVGLVVFTWVVVMMLWWRHFVLGWVWYLRWVAVLYGVVFVGYLVDCVYNC